LPGHGTPPLKKGDVFGEPRANDDITAAFRYVPGSTTGFTTDDPAVDVRWLRWGEVTVPALGTVALHFEVTTSDAKAYYVAAATASSEASVSGTRKGAQIQIISIPDFDIGSTAGDLGAAEPTIKRRQTDKVIWTGPLTVPAHTTLHLVYEVAVDPQVNGSSAACAPGRSLPPRSTG
jgi:hypothetical protein